MADNVPITAGTGTDIATDEVSNVHYQKIKIALGLADAVDTLLDSGQQTMANSLPVVLSSDHSDVKITLDSETVGLAAGDNNVGNVDIVTVPAPLSTTGTGTEATALRVTIATDSTGVLSVDDNNSALTVDNGGTFAVQDSQVIADDGGFTVATSKVFPAGFLADDASPDAADEGDAVAARATLDRKQIVVVGESGANLVRGGGNKTDTTDQSIMAAPGSGFYNYLTWVAVYNSSATNTYVNVKEGSNVVAVIPLPAYGGAVLNLTTPIRGADNAIIYLAAGASVTTASLYGGGYKGK